MEKLAQNHTTGRHFWTCFQEQLISSMVCGFLLTSVCNDDTSDLVPKFGVGFHPSVLFGDLSHLCT